MSRVLMILVLALSFAAAAEEPLPIEITGQFRITLPAGWAVYDQNAALGRADGLGLVLFSSEPVTAEGLLTADPEQLARMDTGAMPSFFVERMDAARGMSCSGLSRSAVYNIGEMVKRDPAISALRQHFSTGITPRHTKVMIGGCEGARFQLEANKGDAQRHWIIDVRAVADDKRLYLFSLRNHARHHALNLPSYEAALASVEFNRGR